RLAADPGVREVIVAPGNPGMVDVAEVRGDVPLDDHGAIVALARASRSELVVIGPEAPLAAGLADRLVAASFAAFGPTRAAARLEASKSFCRDVASAAGVPIPDGASFVDAGAALAFVRQFGAPLVIKADGLAAGKGVTVCATTDRAEAAIGDAMVRGAFGAAGERIVVERALTGREASLIVLTDGESTVALPAARDHKRIGEDDTGPNTGGMGAFSPLADLPHDEAARLVDGFHRPILAELARRGIRFRGALYAGLMLTPDGPSLLECNVRFGDPETQVLLARLETPLAPLLLGAATGSLGETAGHLGLSDGRVRSGSAAVGIVLAAAGYPGRPRTGDAIDLDRDALGGASLFWSGVRAAPGGGLTTDGGRIATVVARGPDVGAAAAAAHAAADAVRFDGRQLRRDIGRVVAFAGPRA
nr:phosphoribosylamine--glycine ligase [Chloroflexota bacterium]